MALRKYCVIVIALIIGSAGTAVALAQTLKIDTVAVAPFGFVDADGVPRGMMYEIGNRIAETAGFAYSNNIVPYARSGQDIAIGTADICLRFSSPQMEMYALQVVRIVSVPIIAIGPKGTRFHSRADLHGKTVGIIRSSTYDAKFNSDPQIKKYEVNDYAQMLAMLKAGRIDVASGSTVGLYYSAESIGVDLSTLGEPFVLSSNDFVLNFSKRTARAESITSLRAAANKLIAADEITKIIDRYMGSHKWAMGDHK